MNFPGIWGTSNGRATKTEEHLAIQLLTEHTEYADFNEKLGSFPRHKSAEIGQLKTHLRFASARVCTCLVPAPQVRIRVSTPCPSRIIVYLRKRDLNGTTSAFPGFVTLPGQRLMPSTRSVSTVWRTRGIQIFLWLLSQHDTRNVPQRSSRQLYFPVSQTSTRSRSAPLGHSLRGTLARFWALWPKELQTTPIVGTLLSYGLSIQAPLPIRNLYNLSEQ